MQRNSAKIKKNPSLSRQIIDVIFLKIQIIDSINKNYIFNSEKAIVRRYGNKRPVIYLLK
jgi:hypothetical protein